ncbi:MAG: hypothetical protein U9O95_04350 [Candidatus Marinimicrobia bacterium]|nr:hypothetical protein [Candidatus Neomarinimicrobiota bacterium]
MDLYVLILSRMGKIKLEYLSPVLDKKDELGIFDYVKQLIIKTLQFVDENPSSISIAKDFTNSKSLDRSILLELLKNGVFAEIDTDPATMYMGPIKNSLNRGEIDKNYSLEIINYYINTHVENFSHLLFSLNINDHFSEKAEKILSEYMSILKHGLYSKNNEAKEANVL